MKPFCFDFQIYVILMLGLDCQVEQTRHTVNHQQTVSIVAVVTVSRTHAVSLLNIGGKETSIDVTCMVKTLISH